jgi:tRNA A-37 threonylcarbamoyl transferase component Bud32
MTYRLTVNSVVDYLRARRVIDTTGPLTVDVLDGGVSSDVLSVCGPGIDVVVKQALPRLRVERDWRADPRRILTEADALRVGGRLAPGDVPAVVDVDDEAMTLTITRADRALRNWKSDLLAGRSDRRTAARLARTLATWHNGTAADPQLCARYPNETFVALRIDPFHLAVRERHPDVAPRIGALAAELLDTRMCLVHGDFSPKNVLADGDRVCVLDWEVAHYGDPVFDLAFLVCHLLLKAVHRPTAAPGYRLLAGEFLDTYGSLVHPSLRRPDTALAGQVATLLLARVDGKSPAAYLTGPERADVRRLGHDALAGEWALTELWERAGA